ncbi:DUF2726 domain-containing protein [Frigidibacter sp. MR17.24]|uniref:DUF2726 domain-containing protein n=1 Tax=Frigidibacter sp. MR17.24 TaxID=3127345 RepID=UPI003012DE0B
MFQSDPHFQTPATLPAGQDLDPVLAWIGLLLVGALVAVLRVALRRLAHRSTPRGRRTGAGAGARAGMGTAVVQASRLWRLRQAPGAPPDLAHDHLDAVARSGFERRRLLNRAEARLLPVIEAEVAALGRGHRVMAQVSLGEILRPSESEGTADSRRAAFNAINAKRLDFAVFDGGGWLLLAIEYQGHGHYHETSFLRDAVKREALRKAGVPFLELPAEITPDGLRALLHRHLPRPPEPRRAAG